jgi:hypothetical protein
MMIISPRQVNQLQHHLNVSSVKVISAIFRASFRKTCSKKSYWAVAIEFASAWKVFTPTVRGSWMKNEKKLNVHLYKHHKLFNFLLFRKLKFLTTNPRIDRVGTNIWILNFFRPRILRYTVFSKNCPKFGRTWSTTMSNRNLELVETLKLYQ